MSATVISRGKCRWGVANVVHRICVCYGGRDSRPAGAARQPSPSLGAAPRCCASSVRYTVRVSTRRRLTASARSSTDYRPCVCAAESPDTCRARDARTPSSTPPVSGSSDRTPPPTVMASVAAYVARPVPPTAVVATLPLPLPLAGPSSSSCSSTAAAAAAASTSSPAVGVPSPLGGGGGGGGKDSRWLTLEVCREHVRRRCTRSDDDCRFAHPPPHVEVQNGRVVCCFDSIKVRLYSTPQRRAAISPSSSSSSSS